VDTVVLRRADVLAISATMSSHLRVVSDLIDNVRGRPECRDVRILVGGYPFMVSPQLWQKMGADGGAANAQEAINLADRWIAHESS
jgi:methanogenic corrinoid protein MtbC1